MKKFFAMFLMLCMIVPSMALAQSEIKLDSAERKKLNTFFSNFSEANLESFTQDTLTEQVLLDFALIHSYINNFKSLIPSPDGATMGVPSALVDKATERYFGRTLASHKEKTYSMPAADGEAYIFSQIGKLVGLGDNRFQAGGIIYSTGSGGTPDPHATPAEWAKADEEVDPMGTFSAVIKKVNSAGKERYILLEYTVEYK